ncbi:MAG: hypothetical protein WCO35_01560 [Candidatus Nomurabacteria bacterium]
MTLKKVFVQQWEDENCGQYNTLSKFTFSLHKSKLAADVFIEKYKKEKKVISINEVLYLNVDEETYNKVLEKDKIGEPYTSSKVEKIDLFVFQ